MGIRRRGPSWFAIIIWFVFFWPIGLYLMIKRLTTDREAAVRRERRTPVLGWFLLFVGLFFLSSYVGNRVSIAFLLALFFICGGISSLSASKRGNMEGERFRTYINAIVNHGLTYIRDIADFSQVSEKQVVKDIEKMIRMGYFDHAHIDRKRGEIYLYQRHAHVNVDSSVYDEPVTKPYAEPAYSMASGSARSDSAYATETSDTSSGRAGTVEKMIHCRNCGAQNWIVPGVRNLCEYCGSVLS